MVVSSDAPRARTPPLLAAGGGAGGRGHGVPRLHTVAAAASRVGIEQRRQAPRSPPVDHPQPPPRGPTAWCDGRSPCRTTRPSTCVPLTPRCVPLDANTAVGGLLPSHAPSAGSAPPLGLVPCFFCSFRSFPSSCLFCAFVFADHLHNAPWVLRLHCSGGRHAMDMVGRLVWQSSRNEHRRLFFFLYGVSLCPRAFVGRTTQALCWTRPRHTRCAKRPP